MYAVLLIVCRRYGQSNLGVLGDFYVDVINIVQGHVI